MKYRLKDICSITKGAIGIMKADGGKYPLVALGEERRSHSEFQFDAKAVIVPLISSTGHGHASMKRVHYQEGKFALGNILCAVIPKDETQLHPKFLHLFLQQFKEKLLVPLMKGAANVSLPMNKLADVEIEVPSLERQLEIIELAEEASGYKNELEERLIAQDGNVTKLRQTMLKEAMQGKLTWQDAKDGNARELLNKIIAAKGCEAMKIKNDEIPFNIPENWIWCKLGDIAVLKSGNQYSYTKVDDGIMFVKVGDMNLNCNDIEITTSSTFFDRNTVNQRDLILTGSIIFPKRGGAIATNKRRVVLKEPILVDSNTMAVIPSTDISFNYFLFWFREVDLSKLGNEGVIPQVNNKDLNPILFPLPPLAEQNRIVKKLEKLFQLCNEMQYSIQQSKIENERLLQGALRDALKKEEVAV